MVVATYFDICQSTNSGASWAISEVGVTDHQSTSVIAAGNTFLFATFSGVFRSTDLGQTWALSNNGFTDNVTKVIYYANNSVYAGTQAGIFRSTDEGATWFAAIGNAPIWNIAYSFGSNGNRIFAGLYKCGMYYSDNSGGSWTQKFSGLACFDINATVFCGSMLYVATSSAGMFRSSDFGSTWESVNNGLPTPNMTTLATDGTHVFAGTSNNGIYMITNSESTWSARNNGLSGSRPLAIRRLKFIGTDLWAGTVDGPYKSTDYGMSWTAKNTSLAIATCSIIQDSIFIVAGTEYNGIYASSNGGNSWTQKASSSSYRYAYALETWDTYLFAGTVTGVYRSSNSGTNWIQKNTGLGNVQIQSLALHDGALYAGTKAGIYKSTNFGDSWSIVGTDDRSYEVPGFAFYNSRIFAATKSGVVFIRPFIFNNPICNSIENTSATCTANIADAGGYNIVARGFCYNTSGNPNLDDSRSTESGSFAEGLISGRIEGLAPNTIYHARPYAISDDGNIFYGAEFSFTTIPTLGEWGLIVLGSLIASIGGAIVWRRLV
jgi:photosystem II stability/assembly factor-like uncharacterized protein